MQIQGAWRWFGIAAVALAAAVLAVVFVVATDPDPAPPAITAKSPEANTGGRKAPAHTEPGRARGGITFSGRGSPIVWVRRGHRVMLHSAPGGPAISTLQDETEWGSRTILAVFDRRDGWAGVPHPEAGNGSLAWVRLDPRHLKSGHTLRELQVDLSERRADLLIDGDVERTFTITVGAPDTTTPTGRFAVTDTFRGDLNPAYGCCAVALTALQPNLPSGWLGGNRIAIHGTSGPLGEAISSGCVRAADRDVSALVDEVPPGAPVLIRQ